MRLFRVLLLISCLALMLWYVPPPNTPIHAAGSGCVFSTGVVPAFCDTFDAPAGTGNRSGALDGTVWGVSRISGNVNLGEPNADDWVSPALSGCTGAGTVTPPADVAVCNGQLREATNDGGTVTTLAAYPKQPFDFAGRTGTVVFDVSDNSQGTHAAWPEFWITDQPLPAPFTHEPSFQSTPRNGIGIRFAACNGTGVGVDSADVVRTYESNDSFAGPGTLTVNQLGCVAASTALTSLNHFEVQVSQSQVDVYGTNAGTTGPLVHLASIPNAGLTLTRGLVWIEDAHYNAGKFNTQRANTFAWDNLGFDGPVLPRDLTFDVLDHLTAGAPAQDGDATRELGWAVPSDGTMITLTTLPLTTANITAASGALLTFNYYSYDMVSLNYSLNGHPFHAVPWPYPDNTTFSWRSLAVPISLTDVTAGANTIKFQASGGADIANVDIILAGAGGIPGSPPATGTPLPSATASPTLTATSTSPPATATAVPATMTPPDTATPVPSVTPTTSATPFTFLCLPTGAANTFLCTVQSTEG